VNAIKNQLGKSENVFSQVKANVIQFFESRLSEQIHVHLMDELSKEYRRLTVIELKEIGDIATEISGTFNAVDVPATHARIKAEFEAAIANKDYEFILRNFNEKKKLSLIAQSGVHQQLDMGKPTHYINTVIRLIGSEQAVADILKQEISRYILQ